MKEYDILVARLDYSHAFKEKPSPDLSCAKCGKIRALHANADFVPNHSPSHLPTDLKASYRGHPYWARPGTLRISKLEADEIERRSKSISASRRHTPLRSPAATTTTAGNAPVRVKHGQHD